MQRQHSSQATSTLGNTPNLNKDSYTKGNPILVHQTGTTIIPWQQPLNEIEENTQLLMLNHWLCKSAPMNCIHVKLRSDFENEQVTIYVEIWRSNNKVYIEYVGYTK